MTQTYKKTSHNTKRNILTTHEEKYNYGPYLLHTHHSSTNFVGLNSHLCPSGHYKVVNLFAGATHHFPPGVICDLAPYYNEDL
jgi:hypothetical protein